MNAPTISPARRRGPPPMVCAVDGQAERHGRVEVGAADRAGDDHAGEDGERPCRRDDDPAGVLGLRPREEDACHDAVAKQDQRSRSRGPPPGTSQPCSSPSLPAGGDLLPAPLSTCAREPTKATKKSAPRHDCRSGTCRIIVPSEGSTVVLPLSSGCQDDDQPGTSEASTWAASLAAIAGRTTMASARAMHARASSTSSIRPYATIGRGQVGQLIGPEVDDDEPG